MANLRQALYAWRDAEAAKQGVDLFRILPNTVLEEIARHRPLTKDELVAIKGIKEAKYRQFGQRILALVEEYSPVAVDDEKTKIKKVTAALDESNAAGEVATIYSVGDYLEIVNRELYRIHARVKGEVVSYKIQGSALYFSIKDSEDDSVLSVFMWLSDYSLFGITIADGMEVVVSGRSEIYKPSGRFNFRAHTIEVVGEGVLKKAYDILKKKLESEEIFAPERKREITDFPERIGLVTSKTGAVIHDFLNNLGKFGYRVSFADSRVEGMAAVKDLLNAIAYFKNKPIDVLVVVRGGGSLESLQAFNNEHVVRAISEFPHPVICAIGHDKDVPLAQLAADYAPSTPTAATAIINRSWEHAGQTLSLCERNIFGHYREKILSLHTRLSESHYTLTENLGALVSLFHDARQVFIAHVDILSRTIETERKDTELILNALQSRYTRELAAFRESLRSIGAEIEALNPLRQLKLGYSILSQNGKILRSVKGKHEGEHFHARLSDGTLEAQIIRIFE